MSSDEYFNFATFESMKKIPNSKWQRHPSDVIPMWLANPDFKIAPEIKEALIKAVEAEDLYYNSDVPAREAMVAKIKRVNGIEASTDRVMITQGVDPIIWLIVKNISNSGDEVVLSNPMYGPFHNVMRYLDMKPVYWMLDFEEGYRFDEERLKEAITPQTKLICLCNPHNPTGRVMDKQELKAVADIAVDHDITVFVDELWEDVRFDGKEHISLASMGPEIADKTVTAWGVSKTFGVAGLFIGYLYTDNKELSQGIRREARTIQRGCSTIARAAAPVMLDETLDWWRRDMMVHLHKIRDICLDRLNQIPGVTFPRIEGTYVPFPKFDYDMTSDELNSYLLKEAKVGLASGSGYGSNGEGHQRICIATSETLINEAIDRIENALNKL
jgi:aspartate/methionine/tyrosine aminotransferase